MGQPGPPGWARDCRSLSRLTDVPPGPLKGLLTHFDYSGPLVTQNITSSGTMNRRRRLSCAASLKPHFPSPLVPKTSHSSHCVTSPRRLDVRPPAAGRPFKEHPARWFRKTLHPIRAQGHFSLSWIRRCGVRFQRQGISHFRRQ